MASGAASSETFPSGQTTLGRVPHELKGRRQWVVWRKQPDEGGRVQKVPYMPDTGRPAATNNPDTWRSYEEAERALATGQWDGVGYVFTADDPYTGIDLDDCRDPVTEELAPWAQAIVERFHTYTEVSPSQTGVKLWVKARKPVGRSKIAAGEGGAIEVYDQLHYFTVTGRPVDGTPNTVEDRQAVLDSWYTEAFSSPQPEQTTSRRGGGADDEEVLESLSISDEELLALAKRSANGSKFMRLWNGGDIEAGEDASGGDFTLCRHLAFWTRKDHARIDRLFRLSERYAKPGRAKKWDEAHYTGGMTYGEGTIVRAVAEQENVYTHDSKRDDRRTFAPYSWQQTAETGRDRERLRRQLSARIGERVREHLTHNTDDTLLVVTAPPGSGKSTKVAELGMGRDIAYIVERHDAVESIESLTFYNHLKAPTAETCPHHEQHAHFARLGFNTLRWHQEHGCAYARQFGREGSTLYMVEHVPTPYPALHKDGIIIDEMSLQKWLPEHQFTADHLRRARFSAPTGSAEERLLLAVDRALFDEARAAGTASYPPAVQGRALFDKLDRYCDGQLHRLVEQLTSADEDALNPRRALTPDVVASPETVVPNILPHLLATLQDELPTWRNNQVANWNGRLRLAYVHAQDGQGKARVSIHKKEWVLGITEVRRFHQDASRSRALLDATADEETLRRVFGVSVHVVSDAVFPPPQMRHLHLSVRYDLTSMRARHGRDKARAIAQLRYLLRQLNLDGSKRAALVTFQTCVDEMGEALGIPAELRGWFWAERGSNRKEDCDILLVIGTPALPPDEVARLARVVYADDPIAIDAGSEEVDGRRRYVDARMQRLSDALTNAELTQCAHRNRPLWHDGRVVVTLCQGTIGYLPITEHIHQLPQLEEDGTRTDVRRNAERSECCRRALREFLRTTGRRPSVAKMREATRLSQQYVSWWMREEAPKVEAEFAEDREPSP